MTPSETVPTIYINGRFLGQQTTGVQRFATELVLAVDALLAEKDAHFPGDFVLVVPGHVTVGLPELKKIRIERLAGPASHGWEQLRLPLFTRNSWLLNLAGSAPLFKRKQLCTFHDAAIFDYPRAYSTAFVMWYRLLFYVQARLCHGLLTASSFSRGRLSKRLGVPSDRFGIVVTGVDHMNRIVANEKILARLGLNTDNYLLTVGSANPAKNMAALTQAFCAAENDSQLRLVVAGGGNAAVFARQEITENAAIIKTGRIDDAELKALYLHARAFVFPSLYEGFGLPPIEAMACGCPVVAANSAAIPEICGSAVGYFDPASVASIRQALERIMTDGAWRASLREAGRIKAKEYSWRAAALQLFRHLEAFGVITGSPPGATEAAIPRQGA
jgi:glycosyltransferase involved in cell wall biosynthesis